MTWEIVLVCFGLVLAERRGRPWKGKKERGRMRSRGPRNVGMGTGMGIMLMDDIRYKVEKDVEKRKRKKTAQILQKEYCMVKRKRMKQKRGGWLKRVE